MDLSVIILSYNTKKLTVDCIKSVKEHTKTLDYEIVVVDNASSDGTADAIKKIHNVKLIESSHNLGFAGGNDLGVKEANGKYILLLNSDTKLTSNILKPLVHLMKQNTKLGVVSCALKNSDGTLQANGGYFPTLGRVISWMLLIDNLPFFSKFFTSYHPDLSFYKTKHDLDWVTGAFLLTRREIWDKLGGLDNKYFMYVEDADFCFRVRKEGWKVLYDPRFSIIHYGGASSKTAYPLVSEFKGLRLFYKKHYSSWKSLVLRIMLKIGAILRMFIMSLFKGPKFFKIYKDAYSVA